jgi:DNA primase
MNASDLEDLLRDLGFSKMRIVNNNSDTNIMVCCPYHGEHNPSMGVSAEKECFGCFACPATGTLVELVMYMKDYSYTKAKDYLEEKFNINMKTFDELGTIRRYGEEEVEEVKSEILPYYKLAPYRSGKIFHQYLLNRGFTKETLKKFMIGWDRTKNRITIPVFTPKNELLGFIGRAVLEPKIKGKINKEYKAIYGNADRYLVYEFQKSHALFPIHLFDGSDTAIIVEGTLDAMWMHQNGFTNTLSSLGAKFSKEQLELLYDLGVKKVILLYDNDDAGFDGKDKAYKLLKNDFIVYNTHFPEDKNDPQNCSKEELEEILQNKGYFNSLLVKKIE